MSAIRTREVLKQTKGFVGFGLVLLPLGMALSLVVIGLFVVGFAAGELIRRLLVGAREVHGESAASHRKVGGFIGVLTALAYYALVITALAAGGAIAPAGDDGVGPAALNLGVTAAFGALLFGALSPLLLTPFTAAKGLGPGALSRSVQLSSVLEGRRLALGSAVIGAASAAWVRALPWLLAPFEDPLAVIVGVPPLSALGLAASLLFLASAHGRAEAQVAVGDAPTAKRRIRGWLWMIAPAAAIGLAAVGAAALTPAPMSRANGPQNPRGLLHDFGLQARLPGTSVSVRSVEGGVQIEADDGGGAGFVEAPTDDGRPLVHVAAQGDDFIVLVETTDGFASTHVNRDGVRLDDDLPTRIRARGGTLGVGLLAVGMLTLLLLSWRMGVESVEVRALDAEALLEPGTRSGGGVVALTGRLKLSEGGQAYYRKPRRLLRLLGISGGGAHLRVEGEAWIEGLGGGLRIRLADGLIPVFPGPVDAEWDHETITILSRFRALQPTGLRESSSPFPDDGRLVLGTTEDAATALGDHVSAVAAPLTVLSVVALVAGAAVFLFS